MNSNSEAIKNLEQQIKLHINNNLYEKGFITKEMYEKAKNIILTT